MGNFTISPGVTLNELDKSYLSGQPIQVGAAIIGPTVKGPVEVPTVVTSYSEYKNVFGDIITSGSDVYSYFTSIAAYNYFNYGGQSLLVARVATGSYSPATSSVVADDSAYVFDGYVSSSYVTGGGVNIFQLETISEGANQNNTTAGTNGSLTSGTVDNIRFEITSPNASTGTFNVVIRQGNDTTNKKVVLESFNGVNLDPKSSNYIARVIGDTKLNYNPSTQQMEFNGSYPNASKYVRVKAVNVTTPDYLDSNGQPKAGYAAKLPVAQQGVFGGATGTIKGGANFYDTITATNTQGLDAGNYTNMINLLSNKDEYRFNILTTPGLTNDLHTSAISTIITNTQNRGDNLYIVDLTDYNSTVSDAVTQAQTRDNSYAATYWPWCNMIDPATGKYVWVPASTLIPGVYANNDKIAAPWFAPAGINRGGLNNVSRAQYKLSQSQKDELYLSNVNPLATMPKVGVVIYGQKTLQKGTSALDRVNVRRLLIELKGYIGQLAENIVFEQNTERTRSLFLSRVNPYLENIQQKQGLYAFRIVMDDTNNGPDVIDRNQLVGQIYIQPTKTAEFISLDFVVLPTGAEFPG
jgi:phage tail sheath protein FI